MGYAAEKREAERKWRRCKLVLFIVTLSLLAFLVGVSVFIPPATWKYRVSLPDVDKRKAGEMRVHFLDVGQGDATLIELPDGKIALIDGGDASAKAECALMRYLYALDIDTIDYLILTHADEDHCGSLDIAIRYMRVKRAYIPLASPSINEQYAQFYAELVKEKDCVIAYAQNGVDLSGNDYTFAFLYPYRYDVETRLEEGKTFDGATNEYSAVLWLEYNEQSVLFTGDLPTTKEEALLAFSSSNVFDVDLSDTEVLKVGHHGSNHSTGERLLQALNAETAVISCGENEYGHPDEELLFRLQEAGIKAYRTDRQGNIVFCVSKEGEGYTIERVNK